MWMQLKAWWHNLTRDKWQLKSCHLDKCYGGQISHFAGKYIISSRENRDCDLKSPRGCKALISYDHKHKPKNGRKTTFEFDFTVTKFDFDNAPGYWVMFQDWVRVKKSNKNGNRPITTLEIKSYGPDLWLRHKESSYQFNNPNGKQVKHADMQIKVGKTYKIKLTITDGINSHSGGASLSVNGRVLSDVQYQTKSPDNWIDSVLELGIYHDKEFNLECDPKKRVACLIENLKKY